MIQVEYLLVVEKADAFCNTTDALNKLLDVDARLTVNNGKIWSEDETKYTYSVQSGEVPNKDQRYFELIISLDEEPCEANVDALAKMLVVVRTVLHRLSPNLETLRDDISSFYSELGYRKIHQIENLMRRLITKFMVVNVGANWIKESTPKPVKEALDASKRKGWSTNVLDKVDFIVLSWYLLHPYSRGARDKALGELESIATLEQLEQYKTRFSLKSNWTRYFSAIVECNEEFLKKRWEQLYELRCKVAHNALINKAGFDEIERLTSELRPPLLTAIAKIGEVEVPNDEVENVVSEASARVAGFSQRFNNAMKNSPQAMFERAMKNSPQAMFERAMKNSPQAMFERAMENSPQTMFERAMENSPQTMFERAIENSPQTMFERAIENSGPVQDETKEANE